jgi:hypothetical protein
LNLGRAAVKGNKDLRDNGWFVFFAPRDNPTTRAVFLEHGITDPMPRRWRTIFSRRILRQNGAAASIPTAADLRLDFSDLMARRVTTGTDE